MAKDNSRFLKKEGQTSTTNNLANTPAQYAGPGRVVFFGDTNSANCRFSTHAHVTSLFSFATNTRVATFTIYVLQT